MLHAFLEVVALQAERHFMICDFNGFIERLHGRFHSCFLMTRSERGDENSASSLA
jgi:hypothetical protein